MSWSSTSGARAPGDEHLLDALGQRDDHHAALAEALRAPPARPTAGPGRRRSRSGSAAPRSDASCSGSWGERSCWRSNCASRRLSTSSMAAKSSARPRTRGCGSGGSRTSSARRPRTRPSRRRCACPQVGDVEALDAHRGRVEAQRLLQAVERLDAAADGGARPSGAPGRGPARRCARPARGCDACRPRSAARSSTGPPRRAESASASAGSAPTARGTTICGGMAVAVP